MQPAEGERRKFPIGGSVPIRSAALNLRISMPIVFLAVTPTASLDISFWTLYYSVGISFFPHRHSSAVSNHSLEENGSRQILQNSSANRSIEAIIRKSEASHELQSDEHQHTDRAKHNSINPHGSLSGLERKCNFT